MSELSNEEKLNNLMLDMDNLMTKSGFSTYLFFCVGDKEEGGFASVKMLNEKKEKHLKAQIIDTLRNNPELHDWLQNILDSDIF
jgi:hypothetical protein